jgi:type IX secretion system PorP/SprF family membrane protein
LVLISTVILLIGFQKRVFAIDPLFSQFYANPLYLNPAFAGSEKCTRMILNYRNQPYPSFGTYSTYSMSVDHYFDKLSGGLGFNVLQDDQGGLLSQTQAGVTYSFHGRLSREWYMNFGIQASYINYRLNWNELVFPDQFSPGLSSIIPSGEIQPEKISSHLADFSAGILFYKENLFAGVSTTHMSQPGTDFFQQQKLSIKYTFHMGYEFSPFSVRGRNLAGGSPTFAPNVIFQSQSGFNRFNYGVYATISPIITGLWFRHDLKHPNSLIFMLGVKQEKYRIGYSYDYSLSGFSGISGGAHELSVLRNFNCSGPNMKYRIINCPTF